jgi:hypothetical protein
MFGTQRGNLMSLWVRLLVLLVFGVFAVMTLAFVIKGEHKAAAGALFVTVYTAPFLVEVFWPGRYVLRKPDGEMNDNLINRLRQFRIDYPGRDGTIFLGVIILLGIGLLLGPLTRLARLLHLG